jgi:hypothetical protein
MENENISMSEIIEEPVPIIEEPIPPIIEEPVPLIIEESLPIIDETIEKETQQPTFINIYSTTEQKINTHKYILFEHINAIFGDCFLSPNTSEIFIWKSGFYSVYTSIFILEACQFSLIKNSNYIAPVSTVGSMFSSTQNVNYFIIELKDEDMITPFSQSTSGFACKLQMINNTKISYMPYVSLHGSQSSRPREQSLGRPGIFWCPTCPL